MESFQRNKVFGDILARNLRNRFGYIYKSIDPNKYLGIDKPGVDVDIVLSSGHGTLFLQLKEVKKHIKTERNLSRSKLSLFESSLPNLNELVKKWERKYGEDAKKLLLILHLCDGYLIPSDSDFFPELSQSMFRGIYLVSPKVKFVGGKIQKEFVNVIKDAFA